MRNELEQRARELLAAECAGDSLALADFCDDKVPLNLAIRAIMAALAQQVPADGEWVLVPRDPTPEMLAAAAGRCPTREELWRAMLAATPQAPQPTTDSVEIGSKSVAPQAPQPVVDAEGEDRARKLYEPDDYADAFKGREHVLAREWFEALVADSEDAADKPYIAHILSLLSQPQQGAVAWTDDQCVEFMAVALRHTEYRRGNHGPSVTEIRQGLTRIGAVPAKTIGQQAVDDAADEIQDAWRAAAKVSGSAFLAGETKSARDCEAVYHFACNALRSAGNAYYTLTGRNPSFDDAALATPPAPDATKA